ncbi:hypothetical protein [Alteribacter natronophilus]|uniref:hypothetical protein n=1 Tax=Alteribacter natronophilus TaxID=2583810 RepID=UPI00110E71B2|nr:hypothetical protein [Alteribacter natronophilus]TMW73913.1 hypothetical protein FGB90_06465 [Alteribacter natronophilus]
MVQLFYIEIQQKNRSRQERFFYLAVIGDVQTFIFFQKDACSAGSLIGTSAAGMIFASKITDCRADQFTCFQKAIYVDPELVEQLHKGREYIAGSSLQIDG